MKFNVFIMLLLVSQKFSCLGMDERIFKSNSLESFISLESVRVTSESHQYILPNEEKTVSTFTFKEYHANKPRLKEIITTYEKYTFIANNEHCQKIWDIYARGEYRVTDHTGRAYKKIIVHELI